MTELDILGVGAWSPYFSNWSEFSSGLATGDWQQSTRLQPDLIPARERRRAPQSVRMAVEVMHQSCEMAALPPDEVATVFSSSMGDMEITDYMCRTLADNPRAMSPTKFHNSVHNASTGYWSIATQSHCPANAVAADIYSASMAFLDGAIQASEENIPVLVVTQEMAAPSPLLNTCAAKHPFSAAFLIAPKKWPPEKRAPKKRAPNARDAACSEPIASLRFAVSKEKVVGPALPADLQELLKSNTAALMLPLLSALVAGASGSASETVDPIQFKFPLSRNLCLNLSVSPHGVSSRENG